MKLRALRYTLLLSILFGISFLLRASLPSVATGTWVAAGNMSAARSGACTMGLNDGRLLISGGADANGPTATADLFSTTGSWSAAASMNSPRSHQSCAVLQDGRVLVAGGTTSGGGITNSAEIYDPSADSWAQAGLMNDARSGATASVLQDGRVLMAGGPNSGGASNTLEIFDPNPGNFSDAGTMSSPRQDHAAAVLSDGRVLIAGGSSDGTNAQNTTDIYDPQAGSVTPGPAMSTPRAKATATTLLDGTILVIGGSNGTSDLASAEFFDPAANNFNAAGSLTTARNKHSAFLLPNNNEVLVVGGQSAVVVGGQSTVTDLASAELYIPWQKAFQATGAMATPRSDATGTALTAVDGRLLIAGGSSASAELYGFATVKTDYADYAPGTTVNMTGSGWQPGETVTLSMVESPLIDTHPTMTAVADAFGNISNNQFSPDVHDLDIRFYLTASGSQSQAQNTFTDQVNSVALTSPTTASPITLSSFPLTVNIAFNYSTSSGTTTGVASVATSPVTNSPTTTLTPGLNQSATIPVTLPATTANGPYNASVTVTNMTGGGANQKSDSANSGVHVDVPITQLIFTTSAFSIPINTCSGKITVESRDSTGAARNPFSNLTVLLSTTSGGGTFYSNSSCNSATTSVVIASNKTSMDFWYTDSNNGQPLITASTSYEAGPNLSATQLETIGTPCTAAAVTTQPTNQSITYGQNAAFTAAASGNPTPTVQWQVDTGSGFTNISGATSTTFTLTTPPVGASGNKYRPVFPNTWGGPKIATSHASTLTVASRATSTNISPLTASTPAGVAAMFTITVIDTDSGTKSNPE